MKIERAGKVYKIGSDLFPVARKDAMRKFHKGNTRSLEYPELSAALESQEFKAGMCYTNANVVQVIAQKLGIPVQFYAGWLLIGQEQMPIHHAWCVIDGNVIDTSMDVRDMIAFKKVDYTKPNWREQALELMKQEAQTHVPVNQRSIWGKVDDPLYYVGSPDSPQNARIIFNTLLDRYPKHPSYHKLINEKGQSKLQEMMEKEDG